MGIHWRDQCCIHQPIEIITTAILKKDLNSSIEIIKLNRKTKL